MPFFAEWSCTSSFEVILARQSSHFPTWASASRTSDWGEGNVLAEKRGDVWAVIGKFGFTPSLCSVRPGLLGVRRADRNVKGSARVAKGGGEDVGGSEVGARNETGNLSPSSAIAGPSRSMHKCGDRVVAARGFAQSVAWAAPVSRDPDRQVAQGTGSQGPAQPRRKRTESTFSSGSFTAP